MSKFVLLAIPVLLGCTDAAGPDPDLWGDVTGEHKVDIADAQQVARWSVGLSVQDTALLLRCGDVTADGVVNVIDAQQIARYDAGLPAAPRIGTPCT